MTPLQLPSTGLAAAGESRCREEKNKLKKAGKAIREMLHHLNLNFKNWREKAGPGTRAGWLWEDATQPALRLTLRR